MAGKAVKGKVAVEAIRVAPTTTAMEITVRLRVPGTLLISGVPHDLLLGEPVNPTQDNVMVHGLWDGEARQIMVRASAHDYTKVQSLGHEWFHGMMDRVGQATEDDDDIVQMTEEDLATMFGWAFLDLVVNNGTIEWVDVDPPESG